MRRRRKTLVAAIVWALVVAVCVPTASQSQPSGKDAFLELFEFVATIGNDVRTSKAEIVQYRSPTASERRSLLNDWLSILEASTEPILADLRVARSRYMANAKERVELLSQVASLESQLQVVSKEFEYKTYSKLIECAFRDSDNSCDLGDAGGHVASGVAEQAPLQDQLEQARSEYWRSLFGAIATLDGEIVRLANAHSGTGLAPNLSIDFDPCWCSEHPVDVVTIANSSGGDLSSAIVRVEVASNDSFSATAWFAVRLWPRDAAIHLPLYRNLNYYYPQSKDDPHSVAVHVWTYDRRSTTVTLPYSVGERDADFNRQLSAMPMPQVGYLTFEDGIISPYHRGLSLKLAAPIPVRHTVAVTFERPGTDPVGVVWSQDSWAADEVKEFRSEYFTFDPVSIAVQIRQSDESESGHEPWKWSLSN